MLKVFGETRRLADLCMNHPLAAANTLTEGPSAVLAEAARDLAGLEGGVGGPDALHAALSPLKNRADIALALAELSGVWTVHDVTAARVDFAERLVDTALRWLVGAAVKRGELKVNDGENILAGICAIAGGDFAHEDLAPNGPLDLIVLYDEAEFTGPAARGTDRVFVRVGAEMRDTFEGKPGDFSLFALRTPLGSGVGGAGYADNMGRVRNEAENAQSHSLRRWLATARIVGGDRTAGGTFLETIEDRVWKDGIAIHDDLRETLTTKSEDVRAPFRKIADVCRMALGGARPVFRSASARSIFETAATSKIISSDAARRLIAGDELAHMVNARTQVMKGCATSAASTADEKAALAALCGFRNHAALLAALEGARIDAENSFARVSEGPQAEFSRYTPNENTDPDFDKLEDLGFSNGQMLSEAIDHWASKATPDGSHKRFSALAPGLLTAFGETQRPNNAVRLFDELVNNAAPEADVFSLVSETSPRREPLIDAFGCFDGAVAPIAQSDLNVDAIHECVGAQVPQTAEEWLSRYTPPKIEDALSLEKTASWRREIIARIALCVAGGATSYDAAADALAQVHMRTLRDAFEITRFSVNKEIAAAAKSVALHVFDGAGSHLPGAETHLGFIAKDGAGEAANEFARKYCEVLSAFGEGVFAILPDMSHRPGGVAGALAPEMSAYRSYVQSEAVAHEQVMFARARVIAGEKATMDAARETLRMGVAGARRADVLFRDLDRARAQRMRRERATSEWDIDRLEGGRNDVELVVSALIYRHASSHPFIQETSVDDALDALARADLIADNAAQALKSARNFWIRMQLVRALGQWSDPVRESIRPRFAQLIAKAGGVQEFHQIRPLMNGYADDVTRFYGQLVLGRPTLNVVNQIAG